MTAPRSLLSAIVSWWMGRRLHRARMRLKAERDELIACLHLTKARHGKVSPLYRRLSTVTNELLRIENRKAS